MVCTIDGRLVPQGFPVLSLNLNIRALKGLTIALAPLEVLEELARLSDVFKLVVSILAIYILLYGCYNTKVFELDEVLNVGNHIPSIFVSKLSYGSFRGTQPSGARTY